MSEAAEESESSDNEDEAFELEERVKFAKGQGWFGKIWKK